MYFIFIIMYFIKHLKHFLKFNTVFQLQEGMFLRKIDVQFALGITCDNESLTFINLFQ